MQPRPTRESRPQPLAGAVRPAAAPFCAHRPDCPGCPRFGEDGVDPAALAALGALAARSGLGAPAVVQGPSRGYRHRARLAVRGPRGAARVGIFASGTHWVVPIPHCQVHHPLVNHVSTAVRSALVEHHVTPYCERSQRGSARYLQIAVERASQSAQVVLVTRDASPEAIAPVAHSVQQALGPALHSLFWNGNSSPNNAILGPDWHCWSGPPALRESFGGAAVCYPPQAFGQSNLPLAERLIEQLRGWVPHGSRVLELYAGVGAIGLSLLERAHSLALNERTPGSLLGLQMGIDALPEAERARVQVHAGPAASAAPLLAQADTVIANPPRKGLDPELIAALREARPARLLCVSCDAASFARDAAVLLEGGVFELRELAVYAMFPFTNHTESAALFEARRR